MPISQDPLFIEEKNRRNAKLCLSAAAIICVICMIGLVGTYAPFSSGQVVPRINATFVYLVIGSTNLVFSLFFLSAGRKYHGTQRENRSFRFLYYLFRIVDMLFASLTFFTTQEGSSFFFEYILITVIISLMPVNDLKDTLLNVSVNLLGMLCIIEVIMQTGHRIAWQDWVDLIAFHIVCIAISQVRWQVYVRYEAIELQLRKSEMNANNRARTDILTGLLNRTALRDDFRSFIPEKLCVAMMDIDAFKRINDEFGHSHGDQVLSTVGEKMRDIFQTDRDFCYRYGGDEFLIISTRDQETFAGSLQTLRNQCAVKTNILRANLSIGYVCADVRTEEDLRFCIRMADASMYRSKRSADKKITECDASEFARIKASGAEADHVATLSDLADRYASDKQGQVTLIYFNMLRFVEMTERLGSGKVSGILARILQILQKYFGEAQAVNLEVDHYLVFAVMDKEQAVALAQKVQSEVFAMNPEEQIILDAGVVFCGHNGNRTKERFLTEVAFAKYACARAGFESRENARLCVFDEQMRKERERDMFIEEHLDEALEKGEIVPYYQPLVGSLSRNTVGFEALARWEDPQRGMIPPGAFVPVLEKTNCIAKLDLYMLRRVCEDISLHPEIFTDGIFVTVNLSRADFLSMDVLGEIEKILTPYGFPADRVQFEITESAMADSPVIKETVRKMHRKGYRIWLDDFGTGQSALYSLGDMPFSGIKLDQSFFRKLEESNRQGIIIQTIAELSHKMGFLMVAEGIESAEGCWYAQNWGVNFIQGYYFSKPLPLDALLNSPFVRRMTSQRDIVLYRPAANILLFRPIEGRFYSKEREPLVFGKAVLERNSESILFLRMGEELQEVMRPYLREVDQNNKELIPDLPFFQPLAERMQQADRVRDVVDFPLQIGQKRFHAQITLLTREQDQAIYVFALTNYGIENPV
ncbi:MAG: EAL domain-containing protein [Bilifractor sp.]